jgi:hypothetical protein
MRRQDYLKRVDLREDAVSFGIFYNEEAPRKENGHRGGGKERASANVERLVSTGRKICRGPLDVLDDRRGDVEWGPSSFVPLTKQVLGERKGARADAKRALCIRSIAKRNHLPHAFGKVALDVVDNGCAHCTAQLPPGDGGATSLRTAIALDTGVVASREGK